MKNDKLNTAYKATRYTAEVSGSELCLRIGEHSLGMDRLLVHHGSTTWAFITACNPFSAPLTDTDNEYRHRQLLEKVSGYSFYPGKGVPDSGPWPPEASVLVVGISRVDAVALGKAFSQNAIVFGEKGKNAELVWIEKFSAPATVLHIPHSSYTIPDDVRSQLLLDDTIIWKNQISIVDAYTDELFCALPEQAITVRFPISRLVLDPERFEDDALEVMAARGVGVIYTVAPLGGVLRNSPSPDEREDLLNRYYRPHHRQLTQAVEKSQQAHGHCLVIDCHSFPERPLAFELEQAPERADICLGTDSFHTPQELVDKVRRLFEERGYSVAINNPFAGALVPMKFYRKDKSVSALMIELNRRLYMDENTGDKSEGFDKLRRDVQEVLVETVPVSTLT